MRNFSFLRHMIILVLFSCRTAHCFYDEGLENLWNSIPDIEHPTIEDYRLFEKYLSTGRRPNLDIYLSQTQIGNQKFCRMFDFKLIGDNNESPIFERHCLHVDQDNQEKCVLLYGSYNGIYPEKVRKILSELEAVGYHGHVLVRIGGFPNVAHGGLKICHVPYAFKVAFIREAQLLGYKNVLWLDSSMHPLNDLGHIFNEIKQRGHFFITVGSLQDNFPAHDPAAANALGIGVHLYDQIHHLSSAVIGLDMANSLALQLIDDWYMETERVYPSMTWFPEELSFSVVAWRLGCHPYSWFGNLVCVEHELEQLMGRRPLEFYLDILR